MDIKTDSLCFCLSGLGVTPTLFPESGTELYSVRLTSGSRATWHCGKNTQGRAEQSGAGRVPRSGLTTHFFILSP